MTAVVLTTMAWTAVWTILGMVAKKRLAPVEDVLDFGVGLMLLVFVGLVVGHALVLLTF